MQENPTTGAILYAKIRDADYDGNIKYAFLDVTPESVSAELDPQDQRAGQWVANINKHTGVFIGGCRNVFGLSVGLLGNVLLSMNGPNIGGEGHEWGFAMDGMDATTLEPILGPEPQTADGVWVDVKEVCCSESV